MVVEEVGEAAGAESVADQVAESKKNVAASNKKVDGKFWSTIVLG